MTASPRISSVWRRLAGWLLATSVFLLAIKPSMASEGTQPSAAAISSADGEAYLRREVLISNQLLQTGRRAELDRSLNRSLSLIASLTNPQAARATVAASLADDIATLLDIGDTERAFGLYKVAGEAISQALPPRSLEAALWRITEAKLLQQVGEAPAALPILAAAVDTLQRIELEPRLREELLAQALTLQAALQAITGDVAAARSSLAAHPDAARFARAGRAPVEAEEVAYLAARSLAASVGKTEDPIARAALQAARPDPSDPRSVIYRAAGLALTAPQGPARRAAIAELARRLSEYERQEDAAGALTRLDAVEQMLVSLALSEAGEARSPAQADTLLTLVQLAGRNGKSFDADALTALGQARDPMQRRTVHQALRLKARRDRLEREGVQRTAAALLRPAPTGSPVLQHDGDARARLRDYDERLAKAEAQLQQAGLSIRGPRLTRLTALQAALAPNEAALAVAPAGDGLAYLCVRQDRAYATAAPADLGQLKLDARLIQSALTADYPPSDALDAQFPVAAAVRLHAALVTPLEPCLRPGDRIVWLGGVADAAVPLAVLLPTAPPKLERGWDLAQADWLVRRHAIAYAGSAGALVALRARPGGAVDLDFLGVGDPVLRGARDSQSSRFDGLAPLPETADELRASAAGFTAARLLTGPAATEGAVRGEVLGAFRYLSFATHGLLRDDLQGLADPALVLTPTSGRDPRDDGLLTAAEIADMNLGARFVALSACNTANADYETAAQDLPALASAFAVSGVPSTLATLWPVDSETSKRVVSGVFTRLRAGEAPADALADAQRAVLAAPPGKAWLHPRFWAPFVLLGDGAAARDGPPSAVLRSVETLTPAGGEVLALARSSAGLAARFIAEPNASGRPGEGVRLAVGGTETWRTVGYASRASRVLAHLDPVWVAGGYEPGSAGRLIPRLDAHDAQGRITATWRGEGLSTRDAGILASARDGRDLLVLVGERSRPGDAGAGSLQLFQVGPELAPQRRFEIVTPPGARLSNATVTPLGDRLLVTYAIDNLRPPQPAPSLDDYAPQACLARHRTVLELRDRQGRLTATATLDDVAIDAATLGSGGTVILGAARFGGCEGERKAALFTLDARLQAHEVFLDATLGDSEVRTLALLSDGRVFAAGYKRNLFAFGEVTGAPGALVSGSSFSTLLVTVGAKAASARLIEAGADLLPTTALAEPNGEVLLGGSLAGRAAIFHLSTPR